MKMTIIKCDICGSEINVKSYKVPMYHKFDATEDRSLQIIFGYMDLCEDCLKKCTNIYDKREQGLGQISIESNPLIK